MKTANCIWFPQTHPSSSFFRRHQCASDLQLNSLLQVLVGLLDQLFSPQNSVPHHVLGAAAAGGDRRKKAVNAVLLSLQSNFIDQRLESINEVKLSHYSCDRKWTFMVRV